MSHPIARGKNAVSNNQIQVPRTRLAPSPTGALHLGNVRTFLVNWALARQRDWCLVLRIDDLDGPRVKPAAAAEAIDLLRWLGMDWDEGPFYQSQHHALYRASLEKLAARGDIYPCRCTRSELQAASRSAPHADNHELRYPGTCRPRQPAPVPAARLDDPQIGWRFRVRPGPQMIVDQLAGSVSIDVDQSVGDFLVCTKSCIPSYQLAVVVDDRQQGINRIVRGWDLMPSTARQQQLMDRLAITRPMEYWHLPLVVGEDGRRLAKRHGDTRVSHYQQLGVPPERIIGLMACWCGLARREAMTAAEFVREFRVESLPAEPVVFVAADDAWLRQV